MWKLSCIVFFLITIDNSSTQDQPGTTEISRNSRNYENQFQRYRSEVRSIEYVGTGVDRRDVEDYPRSDSDEFEDEDLIGKWRNSGSALEPKWRDGDSLPLVPFDDSSRRKKFNSQDAKNEETRAFVSSRHTEKIIDPEDPKLPRVRIEDELRMTKIPIAHDDRGFTFYDEINERLEENYENVNIRYDDSPADGVLRGEKIQRIPESRVSSSEFKETAEMTKNSDVPMRRTERTRNNEQLTYVIEPDNVSRMRYVDAFQTHPNEYELNDEEYQKPRPRKRRPPQSYEFIETRPPTYSISWSTERYVETSSSNLDESSSTSSGFAKIPEVTTRRPDANEKKSVNALRERSGSMGNTANRRGSENAELRSLLKMQQIEGLSLSELLQRRNFTLNDLLGGKAEVLSVLKSGGAKDDSAEIIGVRSKVFEAKNLNGSGKKEATGKWQSSIDDPTNTMSSETTTIALSENDLGTSASTIERNAEKSNEKIDSDESSDEISENGSSENEKLSAIVRLTKPIILPRRNFIADKTSPRMDDEFAEDSVETYQNDENFRRSSLSSTKLDNDEIMEFSDFTMGKVATTTVASRPEETTSKRYESKFNEDSGSTLSIENILSSTQRTSNLLNNRTKIHSSNTGTREFTNSNVFRLADLDYQSDEPHQESVNDEVELEKGGTHSGEEKTTIKIDEIPFKSASEISSKHHESFASSEPYELVVSNIEPEARAEIFELFSTGSSAKRLERLLKSRNMSIDELIELRQRGSSRVHLAEILRSRENVHSRNYKRMDEGETSRVSTTSEDPRIPVTTARIISDIGIDEILDEAKPTEEETNVSFVGSERTKLDIATMDKNDKSQQSLDLLGSFDSLPFFSRRPVFTDARKSMNPEETKSTPALPDGNVVETTPKNPEYPTHRVVIGLVEEITEETIINPIDNDLMEIKTILTNHSIIARNKSDKNHLSKVRPSIIASGAILGVTVVVFCAIFVICRIRQKQRYTYRNNFARSVFQAPTTTARKLSNSSSLNTIMVNVVATSTNKRPERRDNDHPEIDENFESRSDIENDSLDDANDSWETIPDFMK